MSTTMHQSQHRYLQHLSAQRFYEEESGDFTFYREEPSDFTEEELREEAAFRCWLRQIEPQDYPSGVTVEHHSGRAGQLYDWQHGEYVWWTWPVWSSCEHCHNKQAPMCLDCETYMQYCALSEGWTDAFFPTQED